MAASAVYFKIEDPNLLRLDRPSLYHDFMEFYSFVMDYVFHLASYGNYPYLCRRCWCILFKSGILDTKAEGEKKPVIHIDQVDLRLLRLKKSEFLAAGDSEVKMRDFFFVNYYMKRRFKTRTQEEAEEKVLVEKKEKEEGLPRKRRMRRKGWKEKKERVKRGVRVGSNKQMVLQPEFKPVFEDNGDYIPFPTILIPATGGRNNHLCFPFFKRARKLMRENGPVEEKIEREEDSDADPTLSDDDVICHPKKKRSPVREKIVDDSIAVEKDLKEVIEKISSKCSEITIHLKEKLLPLRIPYESITSITMTHLPN